MIYHMLVKRLHTLLVRHHRPCVLFVIALLLASQVSTHALNCEPWQQTDSVHSWECCGEPGCGPAALPETGDHPLNHCEPATCLERPDTTLLVAAHAQSTSKALEVVANPQNTPVTANRFQVQVTIDPQTPSRSSPLYTLHCTLLI